MKKSYEKPQILIEDYSMTEIFATSPCEQKVNFGNGEVCRSWAEFDVTDSEGMPAGVGYLFSAGNGACTAGYVDDLSGWDGICYHGPENNNFFCS